MEIDDRLLSLMQNPAILGFHLSRVPESERSGVLNSFGTEFLRRFELKGSIDDLLYGIKMVEKALEAAPSNSPYRTSIFNNLGVGLQLRFERMGSMEDLNRAIEANEKAVQSFALDHPVRPMCLSNLASALEKRFERTGSMEDLNRSIEINKQAVQSTSPDHSERCATCLNNLGSALLTRFERTGSIEDVNLAIDTTDQAVHLARDHPCQALCLNNLGTALLMRFEKTGLMTDLDRAIDTTEQAAQLTALDHPKKAMYLNNFGTALQNRFERTGSIEDINRAIKTIHQTVQSTPADHPNRGCWLSNLGAALLRRFERTGLMTDLDRAIDTNDQAVQLTALDHPKKAICLSNLGCALQTRFDKTRLMDDLDRLIETIEQAVQLTPPDHDNRAGVLNNLGNALRIQFHMTGSIDNLNRAIETYEQTVQLTPSNHTELAGMLNNLGRALQMRFKRTGSMDDLENSIAAYEHGATSDTAAPSIRLDASQACAHLLISQGMLKRAKPILEAAVYLLPRLSPRLLKRTDAQFNISKFTDVTAKAVSLSLEDMDDPWKCLQLLELGRGILANLQLEVRSDISTLETHHLELARQFQELRDQIDCTSKTIEWGLTDGQSIGDVNSISYMSETFISHRQRLHQQFDDLLAHIRGLQGFDDFLKGPSEMELRSLAKGGAIVVFNVSYIRSDAFLITTDAIRAINFPLLTFAKIKSYTQLFIEAIYERDVTQYSRATRKINSVLKALWDCGVKTILDALGFTKAPSDGELWPRVWWVGSGLLNLLPIHAAGYHDSDPPQSVLDRVISSYAYTVKSLSYAREKAAKVARDSPSDKAIVLAMPTTPGQAPLEFVKEEVKRIKNLFTKASIPVEEMMNAARQQALSALPQYSIAHFTCHGDLKQDPSSSCLLLEDWKDTPLTVADLMSLNTEYAKFAFLSACHSSVGRDFYLLDECINLSSAIQLAGFPCVVGTLWEIDEVNAAEVAVDVYTNMLQGGDGLDFERSAESLHKATRALRERSRIFEKTRPLVWAPYIHIGV